ncbi:MAG TPA: histidine kinase [Bacteroidota bacterium]|nr:histidine kinase [Bacteroidota bacterium]
MNEEKHEKMPSLEHPLLILLIEDVESDAQLIELELVHARIHCSVKHLQTKEEFIHEISTSTVHAILADFHLPHFSALEALHIVKERSLDIPFILVTGSQSEEIAVDCIKQGADDYILKQSLTRLPSALLNAIAKRKADEEKRKAVQDLRISREQLRALSAHIQSVREEERTRIAREIHDELGQSLTALKMDIRWIQSRISVPDAENEEPVQSTIEAMTTLIDATIQSIRRIASELRPGILDDLGLIPAIEWSAQEFQFRTGIRCHFSTTTQEIELDRERSTAIFRILQETLTNVLRHAHASIVYISFEARSDLVILETRDNGRGVRTEEISSKKSLGLLGMKERAALLGGTVEISGIPNAGTTVTVRISRSSNDIDRKKNG